MSTINTNGINVNYPVPGRNNNSQGFRDNFTSIKTNLDTAGSEITDLQAKVVVKQALANTSINNDMANTLISNASTLGFRATTHNLGGALSNVVVVNAALGDVHYGTVASNSNVLLQFSNWAPTETQSNIQLLLSFNDSNSYVSFPNSLTFGDDNGSSTLENVSNVANIVTFSAPYGVTEVDFRISTIDCGNTLTIEPFNRPRISTQVQQRTPAPTGFPGDVAGTVAIDDNYVYVCTDTYNSTTVTKTATQTFANDDTILLNNTTSLVTNAPVVFTGNVFGGLVANTVYYIKVIDSGNNKIVLSNTRSSGTAGSTLGLANASGTMTLESYNGSNIWKRTNLSSW